MEDKRPSYEQAYEDYKQGLKYKEIAGKYGVSISIVKNWKSRQWKDLKLKQNTEKVSVSKEKVSPQKAKVSKNTSFKCPNKTSSSKKQKKTEIKTNSPSPLARFANKNAVGNKGGLGGPLRNKHAVRTHEYETFYYTDLSEDEKRFLGLDDCFTDKYFQQLQMIKEFTRRENKIRQDIKRLRNTSGDMAIESIVKTEETTTHKAKPKQDRILRMEEALTRVQARKQRAIEIWHKMEMEDEHLSIDNAKLELELIKAEAALPREASGTREESNLAEALNQAAKEVWPDEEAPE